MSHYFGDQDKEEKSYIPPDYTDASETIGPSEDSDEDDEDDDDFDEDDELDLEDEEDEGKIENILDEQESKCNRIMQSTPFGSPSPSPTPSWGSQGPSWGGGSSNPNPVFGSNSWGQGNTGNPWSKPSTPLWGGGTNQNISTNGKTELDRSKKVIFIDFLDGIVETYQSNGAPGLLPRNIYDIKPRFDVWQKLGAFNPEKIYAIAPKNLLNNSTGSDIGVNYMLSYYCCALAAFLRLPYGCCQILMQSRIGQPKEDVISSIMTSIKSDNALLIGINSGLYGQSNSDLVAAQACNILYYDLVQLLNSMY